VTACPDHRVAPFPTRQYASRVNETFSGAQSSLPARFEGVLGKDERILWGGTPNFAAFLASGLPYLAIGLAWGALDLFFVIPATEDADRPSGFPFFMLIHLAPFYLSILNMMRLVLVHSNTYYAYSDKRVMMRTGIWGTDFTVVDYDKIAGIEVNVNPIENMLRVGTIKIFSGAVDSRGGKMFDELVGVARPYEVFKGLKQASVDIKTDWNYPNALRPGTNPGYGTDYKPRE